jgi:hypothetical protein
MDLLDLHLQYYFYLQRRSKPLFTVFFFFGSFVSHFQRSLKINFQLDFLLGLKMDTLTIHGTTFAFQSGRSSIFDQVKKK